MTHAATRWLVPLGAAALLLPIARDANACSPWDPALDRTFPAQGDILPAGALLLLDGQVLSPDHLSVTVDGEPAALVLVHERSRGLYYWLWESAYRTMALRIEPPPQPGQAIVVTGDPCLEWAGMSFCDPVELIYSVGEADSEPPDAPVELWYDVYDHGEVASADSSCGATTAQLEFTIWTEIGRERLEYPLEYRLSRRPRDLPRAWDVVEHDWLRDAKAFDPQFRWQYLIQAVQDLLPLAEALCLRLQTFDASGNLGGEIEVCPPCHDQFAGSTGVFAWPYGLPSYDDAWLYPVATVQRSSSPTTPPAQRARRTPRALRRRAARISTRPPRKARSPAAATHPSTSPRTAAPAQRAPRARDHPRSAFCSDSSC